MEARALGRTRGLVFLVVLSLLKQTAGGFTGSPLVTESYLSTDTEDSEQSTDIPTSSRSVSSQGKASTGYSSTSKTSDLHPSFSERQSHTGKNQRHDCSTRVLRQLCITNTDSKIRECVMCGPGVREFFPGSDMTEGLVQHSGNNKAPTLFSVNFMYLADQGQVGSFKHFLPSSNTGFHQNIFQH